MNRTIVTALLLAACTAPSPSTETWQRASLDAAPTDGSWRWFYPDEKHVLAEGRIAGGVRAGTWKFYYCDGMRFSQGAYDAKGERSGAWLLWKPNGAVSFDQGGMECDGYKLTSSAAGSDDFCLNVLPNYLVRNVILLLDMSWFDWSGTGFYVEDSCERPLTDEELRAALEAAAGA